MDVVFRTNRLKKQYENHRQAIKAYGEKVGKLYIQRINTIRQTRDIDELRSLPVLRCHPLKNNRKGQWAVNLNGYFRLIFTLHGERLEIARIEEVCKHYGGD